MYNQSKCKFNLEKFSSIIINSVNSKKVSNQFKLKDAIFDLPKLQAKNIKNNTDLENDLFGYYKCLNTSEPNEFVKLINGNSEKFSYIYNHKTRFNNERDIKIFSLLKQGEDSSSNSIKHINPYKNRENIFKDKFYKLKENDVSKTITAHMKNDCHMYIHPNQARGLTPREAARIQTYPDSYVFKGPLTKWYMQIGNSVPPLLSYSLALSIKEILDDFKKSLTCFDLFSGIGGFRQGVKEATNSLGISSKWVGRCDIDPYANKLYDFCYDVSNELLLDDVTNVTGPLNPETTNDQIQLIK